LQVVLRDGDTLVLLLDEQSRRSVIDFGFFAEDGRFVSTRPCQVVDACHSWFTMRTIKRYSNRKLYDTKARHYVTLADVASFVRQGDDVQVTDYVTSADLTAQTLAQIIFEEEKKSPRIGADVLRKIIQVGLPNAPSEQQQP
jgi:polyhydroxyalkanoate synthesis repressor PhaR